MRLLDVSAAEINGALAQVWRAVDHVYERDHDYPAIIRGLKELAAAVPPGAVLVAVTERDLDDGMSTVYDEARRALALKADA